MSGGFRWNEWNFHHATGHGVTVEEIEALVRRGQREYVGNGKYRVVGRGMGGQWIQVVYFYDPEDTVYVVHARQLNEREKRRERRRRR